MIQDQPRDAIGRYGATLKEGVSQEFVDPDDDPTGVREEVRPANLTQARRALVDRDVDVTIFSEAVKNLIGKEPLRVRGSMSGPPRLIHVHSGFANLQVEDGEVKILAGSASGHPIQVGDGARAEVFVEPRRKVSLTVQDGGRGHLDLANGVHGYQSVEEGGALTVSGLTSGHRITIADRNRGVTTWAQEDAAAQREWYGSEDDQ